MNSVAWRALWRVVVFYTAVALFLTWPVVAQLWSHLAGTPGEDAMQHLWISWWTQKSLLELGNNPAQVDWLYYPDGVIHPMLWVTPYPQFSTMPLNLFFGLVPGYNIHFLLSFVLSGLTAYLLTLYLTHNRYAAVLAGFIFAFFPNRMAQATAHFAQILTYLFPLCALYLIRLKRDLHTRNALAFGLTLATALLVNIVHVAYFVLPLLVVFVGYWAATERKKFVHPQVLGYLGLGSLIATVLTAPFFIPFVIAALGGQLNYLSQGGVVDFSADLLSFVVPAASHPLLNGWPIFRDFAARLMGNGNLRENTVYVGLVPLALAIWALTRSAKSRIWPWAVLSITAMILSLGPTLKVAGRISGVPLPYAIVQLLPFFAWGRIPGRLNETIVLGLAVLAGYGLALLIRRVPHSVAPSVSVLLTLLIGLEYLTIWPFPTMDATRPNLLREWARQSDDFAILDLPQWPLWLREASNEAMFDQTLHAHKIVGGYVWRLPKGRDGTMKAFQELLWPDSNTDIVTRARGVDAIPLLSQYGIRYVLLHPNALPIEDRENDTATVSKALGPPIYRDDRLVVFAVPQEPAPSQIQPLLAFSYNWYMVEPIEGRPARWLMNDGMLYIHWLHQPNVAYQLTVSVTSFRSPRHLNVSVNGTPMVSTLVEGKRQIEIAPVRFAKGQNEILFHVSEGCEVPAEIVGNEDRRCLSMLFQDMRLSPMGTVGGEAVQ